MLMALLHQPDIRQEASTVVRSEGMRFALQARDAWRFNRKLSHVKQDGTIFTPRMEMEPSVTCSAKNDSGSSLS